MNAEVYGHPALSLVYCGPDCAGANVAESLQAAEQAREEGAVAVPSA